MKINEAGLKLIKNYEGCKLEAYKCSAGKWTIGWGHTGKVGDKPIVSGMKITQKQADDILKQDLVKFENYVSALKRDFNENQFSALVSFCYNCGPKSLQTLCKNRTNAQIADAMLKYNKAKGKVLTGLTKRRKAERELYLTPVTQVSTTPIQQTEKLPYKVKVKQDMNIRKGSGVEFDVVKKAKKGDTLMVWAIETKGTVKWGKNSYGYFMLTYCEKI